MRISNKVLNWLKKYSEVSQEIQISRKPIVALESTVITHGMPYPDNLRLFSNQ